MKAVLLAAGVGRRLGSDRPKALLEVGGATLLERHLANLRRAQVAIRVVTGFHAELLAPHLEGVEVRHNPEYRRGSLLSFAAGLQDVDDDVVVMDADVLYHPSILFEVMALTRGCAIDTDVVPGDEEMMIGVKDGEVRAIRRGLREGYDLIGEGVGFFTVDRNMIEPLLEIVETCDPEGDYEVALDRFVSRFGADFARVDRRPWTEIDFPEDVRRAETEVLPRL